MCETESQQEQQPSITNTPTLDLTPNKDVFVDFDFDRVQSFVTDKIKEIEKDRGIRVLLAVERSSHIWGSSHKLSDFDVKAIFYYNPRMYYSPLTRIKKDFKIVYGPRGTDDKLKSYDIDLEFTFWELKFSCNLSMNNDPNILEMFKSPIIYYFESRSLLNGICINGINSIESIICQLYDYKRLMVHYYSWSKGHYTILTQGSKQAKEKPLKLYVISIS